MNDWLNRRFVPGVASGPTKVNANFTGILGTAFALGAASVNASVAETGTSSPRLEWEEQWLVRHR
jgi:hypothetical protein